MRSDRARVFYMCGLSAADPRFPKYPRLPVLRCAGYESATDSMVAPDEPAGDR